MITTYRNDDITVDRLKPGRIVWFSGDDDTAVISTVDDDALTIVLLNGNPTEPGQLEGTDIGQITLVSTLTVFELAERLYRKHPQLRRRRWAKLKRRANLPDGYQLMVGTEAGSDWPVMFMCDCLGFGGSPQEPRETTPRWRGVREAARETLKECAKATSFVEDFEKENLLRIQAEAKVSKLERENEQLKRKARKR